MVSIKENLVGKGHCLIQTCKWKVNPLNISRDLAIQEIVDHMVSAHHFPEELARKKAEEMVSD